MLIILMIAQQLNQQQKYLNIIYLDLYINKQIKMQNLTDVTKRIRKWNMMGYGMLPALDIVIITSTSFQQQTAKIMALFPCTQLEIQKNNLWSKQSLQKQKIDDGKQEKNQQQPQKDQVKKEQQSIEKKESIQEFYQPKNLQRVYILKEDLYGKIHVIKGLSDTKIKDQQFRQRKKLIEKYRRQKYTVFIVFTNQDKKQLLKNQQNLLQFGLVSPSNTDSIVFHTSTHIINPSKLVHQVLSKYENTYKYELVTNYRKMKQLRKQYQKSTKRYFEWKKVINHQISPTTFSLFNMRMYTDTMKSSFSGTYSVTNYQEIGISNSINWIVMELLHNFWEVQSETLFKKVDSFPLSYIEQQYKMSDHYSIGGFLPDTCFKAIFSPPLYEFQNSLLQVIQKIKQTILRHIEQSVCFIFQHTNIKQQLVQKQMQNIQAICDKFYDELNNSLESQIQFIHANPEEFWNYRQLNSSFYSPDQQVYIQIKYIGKAYVRKVYQSIKDAVPRFIGQGLLKRIVKHLSQQSINTFIQLTKKNQFQISLTPQQINKYESDLQSLKQIQNLITFFSMKIGASFLIKNFHQKKQKQWDRMFGRSQKIVRQQQALQLPGERKGMFSWMRKIFRRNRENRVRRVNSGEKKIQKIQQTQDLKLQKMKLQRRNMVINEKNWLLIINTGRQVSHQRIKLSAFEGFPSKFRSSIWMYLSTKGKPKHTKLKQLLTNQKPEEEIVKQIDKDIPRTSPGELFRFAYKSTLKNILIGYSLHDKEIGYTQGMNFITAVIITTLINYGQKTSPLIDNRINYQQIQQKSFCILKHLMQQCGVRKLMRVQQSILTDLYVLLSDRITILSPKMHSKILQTGFTTQSLFTSPLISCLSNVTKNLILMRRFLDVLMVHDYYIVYRIIAQFVAHCEFIADKINGENVYDFLKNKMYDEVYGVVGDDGLTKMFNNL